MEIFLLFLCSFVSKHQMLDKFVHYINSIDSFIKYKLNNYPGGTSLLLVHLGLALLYNQSVLGILFLQGHPDENKPFFSITAKIYSQLGDYTQISKTTTIIMPIIREVSRCSTPAEILLSSRISPKCPKFNQVGDKSCLSTNTSFQAFNFIFRYLTSHLISPSSFSPYQHTEIICLLLTLIKTPY